MGNQKTRYKIHQLQRVNEDDNRSYDVKLNVIGEYETRKEYSDVRCLCEDLWDSCNITCWYEDWKSGDAIDKKNNTLYPTEHFKGYCNDDIVIECPNGELYKADGFGWTKVKSLYEAVYRIIYQYSFIRWDEIRNKSDFNEEEFNQVVNKVDQEFEEKYKDDNVPGLVLTTFKGENDYENVTDAIIC